MRSVVAADHRGCAGARRWGRMPMLVLRARLLAMVQLAPALAIVQVMPRMLALQLLLVGWQGGRCGWSEASVRT